MADQAPTYQQQIQEILDHFDFRRVSAYMRWAGWHWFRKDAEGREVPYEPQEVDLRNAAARLLKHVADCLGWCEVGGLRADLSGGKLRLAFELESWNAAE
jgi:hypothetical protein